MRCDNISKAFETMLDALSRSAYGEEYLNDVDIDAAEEELAFIEACDCNGWIDAKDRMPEDDLEPNSKRCEIRVLVCTAGRRGSVKKVSRTCYSWGPNNKTPVKERKWYWSRDIGNVTHWMPLPEPPKEK